MLVSVVVKVLTLINLLILCYILVYATVNCKPVCKVDILDLPCL